MPLHTQVDESSQDDAIEVSDHAVVVLRST